MNDRSTRRMWMIILLVILTLLVISELAAFLLASGSDLSTSDQGPGGLSITYDRISDEYDVEILLTSPALIMGEADPEHTLFISLGPQREYTITESHSLMAFHEDGGKLLIADDTGRVNSLTSNLDITIVDGQLYDETFKDHPDLVAIDDVDLEFFSGFLLLNRPSSVIFSDGRGMVRTSPSSWVDRNGNGVMDNLSTAQGEAPGPRYISVISDPDFRVSGSGTMIVISDPSLFMNHMIGEEDNMEFIMSLVGYLLPDGGKVIFDESVHNTEGGASIFQNSAQAPAILLTDINLKIVVGTTIAISLFALAYVHESPGAYKHISFLDRTGVAEIVDPDIGMQDIPEIRSVFLDRVRVKTGMSREAFSDLEWDEVRRIMNNELLYDFARHSKVPTGMDLTSLLLEVNGWEMK